ncbi:thiamine-phosphate kinase [bacterium]|nr:thiamine-phosphate kinase [bacterium]
MREFELIGHIRAAASAAPLPDTVRVGIGDDCCVLQPLCADELVLSTDALVEDVHFRLEYFSHFQVGARAAAAALSDLAAMAAAPLGLLATVALPQGGDESAVSEICRGLLEVCGRYGCPLLGGDLTASPGPLMLSLTVAGKAASGGSILRSGAEPGNYIWVTGSPGEAAAVLEYLELERAGKAEGLPRPDEAARERFFSPQPRIPEALFLKEAGPPAAMIDISDGLAGDLGHILEASGVGAEIEESALPLGEYPVALARALGKPDHHYLFHGGEDYELCLTAPPGALQHAVREFNETFGLRLTRIGTVTADREHLLLRGQDSALRQIQPKGYEHFA